MKRILGMDIGTNSVGWALIEQDFASKTGRIIDAGVRVIPMSQDILGKFDSGQSHSQTENRTKYRSMRRLRQRHLLRRERLHRVLKILGFLPEHYAQEIDFTERFGQFRPGKEPKINYKQIDPGKFEFLFPDSFDEMVEDFKKSQPQLLKGDRQIPYDWTLYYLRQKALSEKISKEELAWIILNFNQKRGYYQLRGEEEEESEGKEKTFEVLKVAETVDSGDKIKGKPDKLFDIYFENGWKYDKQTTKPEDWIGKTKEFIVTTSETKSGDIKRTFKAVNSEEDWIAIKKKTEQEIERSGKTVGQFIYDTLLKHPSQKIRGKLVKTIERKYYKEELENILGVQARFHIEFSDKKLYQTCLEELYPRNEAHQRNIIDRDLVFLFVNDIIFYQRPLKSKKSTIANCQYETRIFLDKKEKKEVSIKGIPKSHPLFQEFRLWQFLHNLKIYKKESVEGNKTILDLDITPDLLPDESAWVVLFDYLTTKKEVEQKHIIEFFVSQKKINKQDKENYQWNYPEDKKYPIYDTRAEIWSRLKKMEGIDQEVFLNAEIEQHLWHIIYSVKDIKEYAGTFDENGEWSKGGALSSFAKQHGLDLKSFVAAFKRFPPFKNEYGAYSEKAIKKLLPLMRMGKYWSKNDFHPETKSRIEKILNGEFDEKIGDRARKNSFHLNKIENFKGLPLWLTCYVVYDRHSEAGDINQWKTTREIDQYLQAFRQHSLRNPIVEQVVTETLRVVRDIWNHHGQGKEKYFDEIHVELGREMKNPAGKREAMSKRQQENENTNQRIKALLYELKNEGVQDAVPYSPSQQEILKLYEEGVYQNSPQEYRGIKTEEIDKIRRSSSPTAGEITRYKLWLEQGYISPYTGQIIPLSKLFTTAYQIEHIIPQSRYFDDSLNNKVICESEVNELKGNKTAFQFITNPEQKRVTLAGGKFVEILSLAAYEQHCTKYFAKNRQKLKNLLSEDIPEGFIERQMNDTRYISKFVTGLLSNIVREEDEQEVTSKNLLPVSGAITSKLKQDWGLNDQWNDLVAARFIRLNELTKTNDFGYYDEKIRAFRSTVPEKLARGFSKKRIDHRHHALDAIVIACTHRKHVQYLNSLNNQKLKYELQEGLLVKNAKGHFTRHFLMPWKGFPVEVKDQLQTVIISFKQNLRVINKTVNKYWKWEKDNGQWKKKLVPQKKGDSWAIRKSLHKETVSGKIEMDVPKGQVATATRKTLTGIGNQKQVEKIVSERIREIIIPNHLQGYLKQNGEPDFEQAFNPEGIEALNENIQVLNNNKPHKPINKVKIFEVGNKFPVAENGSKAKKFVEAATGTNLFFAIYWNEEKQERAFKTIPLYEVIEHQKQEALLPKEQRTTIPIDPELGTLLFSLSPNDLVYVPTDEEQESPRLVDFENLNRKQLPRLFNVNDFSGNTCYFAPNSFAKAITSKEVDMKYDAKRDKIAGSFDSKTASLDGFSIKEICWKLTTNRLGKIEKVAR